LLLPDFQKRYETLRDKHLNVLALYNEPIELAEVENTFFEAVEYIKGCRIVDTEYLLNGYLKEGKRILAEGAQGSLLDIDFGSYPYVTSSNTMAAGACTGLGVAPGTIGEVYGIFKAYCTRVGSGPFPTELHDETGERMRQEGREFGSTTGRPRRCGWLDLPAMRYAIMLSGVTQLFMMKADVLNIFEEIKICTHYELPDGSRTEELPYDMDAVAVTPVYKSMKGWHQSLEGLSEYSELPQALLDYVQYIEEELGLPINIISTGPDRTETIMRKGLREII
jgi:adenylosuccinate synthase